ncbi:Putative AC transposase AltName: Full=ORFA [Rhizoctonia solani AG-1 IB]|uniref:Rhizoctonia solani AG1-IB WGS project CAOJ00000000 data, isolate 7/3/14, contig 20289 n=1 Tax=Thanatephorus cucumeris (strain AG1-IB / isolate 7/3/14) TaxID=1108050 RepID=M5C7B6_THACB|nr:Putative AC transposase AltName: Full=ORFA [Rhizoctonia solani AG-1 IB]
MKENHSTIWIAAKQADNIARLRAKGEGTPMDNESSVLAQNEVSETFIDAFYKKLIQWIVVANHPFTEIEHDEFCDLMFFLKPGLSDHLVQATALRERVFSHAGLLAIGCDAWTSSNRIAFLAITASWITNQWELRDTLIDFRELQGAHTGQNMAEQVASVVSELGIEDKVLALVSDNASNNGTLVTHLSNTLGHLSSHLRWDSSKGHIRCLPHVIHLAVMALLLGINAIPHNTNIHDHAHDDNLFTEDDAENIVADDDREAHEVDGGIDPLINLKSAIDKIRKICRIIRSSPQQMELFKTLVARIEEDNEQQAKARNQS